MPHKCGVLRQTLRSPPIGRIRLPAPAFGKGDGPGSDGHWPTGVRAALPKGADPSAYTANLYTAGTAVGQYPFAKQGGGWGCGTRRRTANGARVSGPRRPELRARVTLVGVAVAAVVVAAQVAGAAPMRAFPRAAGSRAASGSGWSIVPSPSPNRGTNELAGVSCVSATDCTAVGGADFSGTLVQHWNGTAWSTVPSPSPSKRDGLFGVSCVSATDCTAVGGREAKNSATLVEHWNGSAWSLVPSPTPAGGAMLTAVSCASATACMAVGTVWGVTHGSTFPKAPLGEQWNGVKWSITPLKGGVSGVSCVSATDCIAVGGYAEHWNGAKWSVIRGGSGLDGVSCVSPTDCIAVGVKGGDTISSNRTVVERWSGKAWSIIPVPVPKGGGWLSAVSCVSATTCTAVGFRDDRKRTLV